MAIAFKVLAFIWFLFWGNLARVTIWGAAEEHEIGLFMSYLVYQWLIALALYFVGVFIRRVNNAEDRLNGIIRKRSQKK